MENTTTKGLNLDRLMRALIENRSMLNPIRGLSPDNMVFGREMRGFTPYLDEKYQQKREYQLEQGMRKRLFEQQNERTGEALGMRTQDFARTRGWECSSGTEPKYIRKARLVGVIWMGSTEECI